MQDPESFLGPLQAISCHLRCHKNFGMQAHKLTAEEIELDDDECALAEFLAGLKDSSPPPAATQGTRTLPDLPWSTSSPVLRAPAPCRSQGLGVRCPAC